MLHRTETWHRYLHYSEDTGDENTDDDDMGDEDMGEDDTGDDDMGDADRWSDSGRAQNATKSQRLRPTTHGRYTDPSLQHCVGSWQKHRDVLPILTHLLFAYFAGKCLF